MKGYLVLGPESSGTNLTRDLLWAGGCRLLGVQPPDHRPPLLRISLPFALQWPSIPAALSRLKVHAVWAVVTTRDVFAMAESQVAVGHVPDLRTAFDNITRAYAYALTSLNNLRVPFVLSSYESLTTREGYAERLLSHLGLEPATIPLYDGNRKWYETTPSS